MTNRTAMRESFKAIPETCPAVDEAASDCRRTVEAHIDDCISELVDRVKEQTTSLRAALTEALEEKIAALDRVADLESQVASLRRELDDALSDVQTLEASLCSSSN